MTEMTADKCNLCETFEMVPVPRKGEEAATYWWCPNCDNPRGQIKPQG